MNAPSPLAAHHQPHEHAQREAPPIPEHGEHTQAEAAVHAARPSPQKPEGMVADHHAVKHEHDPNLVPHPVKKKEPVIQSLAPHHAANDHTMRAIVLDDQVMAEAEKKLATHIGTHILPELTEGLVLKLEEDPFEGGMQAGPNPAKIDSTRLKMCFMGPRVGSNAALMESQVIEALERHPAFAELQKDGVFLNYKKETNEYGVAMVNISAELKLDQYAKLVRGIAEHSITPEHAAQHVEPIVPQHEQIMAQATAAPAEPITAVNEGQIGVVGSEEKPQASIQAPIAALEKALPQTSQVQI